MTTDVVLGERVDGLLNLRYTKYQIESLFAISTSLNFDHYLYYFKRLIKRLKCEMRGHVKYPELGRWDLFGSVLWHRNC